MKDFTLNQPGSLKSDCADGSRILFWLGRCPGGRICGACVAPTASHLVPLSFSGLRVGWGALTTFD